MAERRTSSVPRKVMSVAVAAAAVLVVAGGLLAYQAANPGRGTFCTAAGSIGRPVAATPEEAFDGWWAEFRPGIDQADGDIERDGTTWHVDKGRPDWVKVEVERAGHWLPPEEQSAGDQQGWTVVAANSCSYA